MKRAIVRVIIADDTAVAREGLKTLLDTAGDIEVVGSAGSTLEATRKTLEIEPDVIIMDLKWFGDPTAGYSAIKEIKTNNPLISVIAVTAYEDLIQNAREAGADIAMTKTFTREELINAIYELASREEGVLAPREKTQGAPEILTKREREVLKLVVMGLTDKEIAASLNIAVNTAKNHVQNILSKLGARNRTHAADIARELGLE